MSHLGASITHALLLLLYILLIALIPFIFTVILSIIHLAFGIAIDISFFSAVNNQTPNMMCGNLID